MHTHDDVNFVSATFYSLPEVRSVLAFGPVMERGEGDEIKLVIELDEEQAYAYARYVMGNIMEFSSTFTRGKRALEFLGLHERAEHREFFFRVSAGLWVPRLAPTVTCERQHPIRLDLYLFPVGWENKLDELAELWEIRNPMFLTDIARHAKRMPRPCNE